MLHMPVGRLWTFSPQGERKNPFKGRWRSDSQALKYRAEQRLGRREKDCAKQQFYVVFVFCCKKQGVATVGWVCLQPVDALQLPVVFPLQPWDALQPWDVFGTFGKKEGMVKPSLLIFNQRFRADECGYVCGFAPRNPAPGRAPQGGFP